MRRILEVLIVILLIPTVVFAEVTAKIVKNPDETIARVFYSKGKEIAREILDKRGQAIKTTGTITDGIVKELNESGKTMVELSYKNGKLEGVSKWFYNNGSLRGERTYKGGKQDGISRFYYFSGALEGKWNYKDGKKEGVTTLSWENGHVKAERNYKNDKREGINKQFYKSGELRFVDTHKEGKKVNRKQYSRDGTLVSDTNY